MTASDPESMEARLTRELAAVSDTTRSRVILGALSLATADSARRRNSDAIAAVAAMVIAVVSLVLLVDQTRTQRRQLGAAVWPSVRLAYSNLENPDHPAYRLALSNGGVGPARIQSFTVRWQGKPVTALDDWTRAACPNVARTWTYGTQTGTLLSAGAQAMVIQHPRGESGGGDECIERTMLKSTEIAVCYCSVLDDCWTLSGYDEPVPVHDCAAARREPQFERGN